VAGEKGPGFPKWIERVSWSESKVFVNLLREAIKQSPEYTDEYVCLLGIMRSDCIDITTAQGTGKGVLTENDVGIGPPTRKWRRHARGNWP
jgi:hypothetical protein